MNRPKRENFKSHIEYDKFGELEFNGIDDYYESLEKYCDELEHEFEALKEEYNAYQEYSRERFTTKDWYRKKIKRLEKALDEACEELARDGKMLEMTEDFIMYCRKASKEEWKEWLMEDE